MQRIHWRFRDSNDSLGKLLAAAGLLLLATAWSVPALAESSLSCDSGSVRSLHVSPGRSRVNLIAELDPSPGFDPMANGLTLDLAYEPEADPANIL